MAEPVSMSLSPELLRRYPAETFIETGTAFGGGVRAAYESGVFRRIHSIEMCAATYKRAAAAVGKLPGVVLHLGDSVHVLPGILKKLEGPCTLFLDAHWNPWSAAKRGNGWTVGPIRLELRVLAGYPILARSVILVDDIDVPREIAAEVEQIKAGLLRINPGYRFSVEDSCRKDSLLVAQP